MSNNQQQELIKQYFQSLVDEFVKDPQHQNITIVFVSSFPDDPDQLGYTHWRQRGEDHKYTVEFLSDIAKKSGDEERFRGSVCHEFAHVWLFSQGAKQKHNDNFYSKMDYFEDWLDKKWGLTPRRYKGGDWDQHVDPNKQKQRENQYTISENNEFSQLVDSLRNSKTLIELENNWQTVKNNSLYSNSKYNWTNKSLSNKSGLDNEYNNYKNKFQDSRDSKCSECQAVITETIYHSKSNQVLCKECYNIERERERERERRFSIVWTYQLNSLNCRW